MKGRLTEQNSAAIRSLLMKYGNGIKRKTGLELGVYIERLCRELSRPYRDIAPNDPRKASALDLLESLDKIEVVRTRKSLLLNFLREIDILESSDDDTADGVPSEADFENSSGGIERN